MKDAILVLIFCLFTVGAKPQALPIYIDGTYNDWETAEHYVEDELLPGENIDFLKFTVTNDNDFLFIKVDFSNEIDLTENNEIYLDIDADNDPSTGWQINGIGSEMDWNFGQRFGYLNEGGSWEFIEFPDIQLRVLPTVTSTSFEIAIGRHVKPNGTDFLFTGDTIKLCFTNYVTNGDNIPNPGEYFTYVFDNTNVDPSEPILLEKEDDDFLRLMCYNIKNDFENNIGGLDDPERIPGLARIFTALTPDIVTINECWNTTTTTAKDFLDLHLPVGNGNGWYANKLDLANITASRYPIIETWQVHPDRRITACLIDLPATFQKDILVISAHFKCCDDDETRQMEADAFVSFILDAKTPGGIIDLPENTPFVLMGDLNLVGLSQQLTTLLSGDIQDVNTFGQGAPPDWDNSNLEDLISRQSDKRMAYTWRNDWGSYPPGRLDFMIYSNSVLEVEKAYTLQTEIMPMYRLQSYGLDEYDTRNSSDHFPKVTDFTFKDISAIDMAEKPDLNLEVYPVPSTGIVNITSNLKLGNLNIYDSKGEIVGKEYIDAYSYQLDSSQLPKGIYLIHIETESITTMRRILIK